MRFVKLTNKENANQYLYLKEGKSMTNDGLFDEQVFTHETIPLEGLSFIFNTDMDSHFYVRQILWHRLKMEDIVKTEDNENILLDIVPDYYTTNEYPVGFLTEKFYQLRETCAPLIRKMYNMLISFIRVVDNSILYVYYDDITRLRNIETSEILNYMYAFYPEQMTELFSDIVIPEYLDRYYKVKSKAFRRIINYHESIDVKLLSTPYINTILDESDYIKSNNPLLLEQKKSLYISDTLYNSLFIATFEEQKKYV